MKKLICSFIFFASIAIAQQASPDFSTLEGRVTEYLTAFVRGDTEALYKMLPPYVRDMVSYPEMKRIPGAFGAAEDIEPHELLSATIESVDCFDDPNFSHICELRVGVRVKTPSGDIEEGVMTGAWEYLEDGVWYSSVGSSP